MIFPDITRTADDLQQILHLQQQNLKQNLDEGEKNEQGFVTLEHDMATLRHMHELAPGIVVKDNQRIVGYALTMLPECRSLVPDLEPMFALLETLSWRNSLLSSYRYYVMGQVCIAKEYRGRDLFKALYHHHRQVYQPRFDLIVTEISMENRRSLRAHEKIGFKPIHTHNDELDEWSVVAWDWSE
jgi:hypothetical protein